MEKPSHNVTVVIVAAGSGTRFGADMPKQFVDLCGRPVLMHTIDRFRRSLPDARILLVLSPDMRGFWEKLCSRHGFVSPRIVSGGATRWESVGNAIAALTPDGAPDDIVLVHDGARPLVDTPAILRVVSAVEADGRIGAIPVVPVTDSLRQVGPEGRSRIVDRSQFRAVQTPQGFLAGPLRQAYRLPYSPAFTDDASVVETAFPDSSLSLVDGDPTNIKITNPADLAIAEALLSLE